MYRETKELTTTRQEYHELAEAIRRGCKVRPIQAFGAMSYDEDDACAWAAAQIGGFTKSPRKHVEYPCCAHLHSTVLNTVIHLNDDHKWSRERIADWLDSI